MLYLKRVMEVKVRMAKAKLGSGARFKALAKKTGSKALAAWIGRKKLGKAKFQALAKAGRKRRKR